MFKQVLAVMCVFSSLALSEVRSQTRETPLVKLIREVTPTVALLTITEGFGEDASYTFGTGIVVHSKGYILTNAHVVEDRGELSAELSLGRGGEAHSYPARVVARNLKNDLALVHVEINQSLTPARAGTLSEVLLGESIVAIGNPLGFGHAVTQGIVSAIRKRRSYTFDKNNTVVVNGHLQLDANINTGNSGGPVFNMDGDWIGTVFAKSEEGDGVSFAISVDEARDTLANLASSAFHRRIHLGVLTRGVRNEAGASLVVDRVESGSPAETAGLQAGDRILTVEGVPVQDRADLELALIDKHPGDSVLVRVARADANAGGSLDLPVTLGKLDREPFLPETLTILAPLEPGQDTLKSRWGVVARNSEVSGIAPYKSGVRLVTVQTSSPAKRMGLHEEDVIVTVNNVRTPNSDKLATVLENWKTEKRTEIPHIVFLREGKLLYLGELPTERK